MADSTSCGETEEVCSSILWKKHSNGRDPCEDDRIRGVELEISPTISSPAEDEQHADDIRCTSSHDQHHKDVLVGDEQVPQTIRSDVGVEAEVEQGSTTNNGVAAIAEEGTTTSSSSTMEERPSSHLGNQQYHEQHHITPPWSSSQQLQQVFTTTGADARSEVSGTTTCTSSKRLLKRKSSLKQISAYSTNNQMSTPDNNYSNPINQHYNIDKTEAVGSSDVQQAASVLTDDQHQELAISGAVESNTIRNSITNNKSQHQHPKGPANPLNRQDSRGNVIRPDNKRNYSIVFKDEVGEELKDIHEVEAYKNKHGPLTRCILCCLRPR